MTSFLYFMSIRNKIKKTLNNEHFKKYEKWVSLLIWLVAIYLMSNSSLKEFVVVADWWELILRKMAHIFEFGILAWLFFRILGQTEKRHVYWNLFWAFIFTVLYAISDEYHQAFIVGRSGNVVDVFIDSLGGLISIWLIYLNYRHKKIKQVK